MTRTALPQRPWVELAPPPDGLGQVRHEARRRRRRRAVGVAAGSAGLIAAGVVVALVAGGGVGVDVLRPVPPAGVVSVSPQPSGAHQAQKPAMRPAGHAPASGSHRVASGPPAGQVTMGAPTHPDSAVHASGASGTSLEPVLERYQSTQRSTNVVTVCGESASSGDSGTQTTVDWCIAGTARKVDGGVRLALRTCRDDTGGGTLSYSGTREIDFAVQQGSHTVWDWANAHPGTPSPHTLDAPADGCWNWTLVWPDVAQDGSSAGHGQFTLVATSTAQELQAVSPQQVQFTY